MASQVEPQIATQPTKSWRFDTYFASPTWSRTNEYVNASSFSAS